MLDRAGAHQRPAEGTRFLSDLSERYLGLPLDKRERTSFALGDAAFTPGQLEYARRDLLATFHVLLEQMPGLLRDGLEDTARLECRAVPAFADLRYDGVFLDGHGWQALIDEARRHRDEARKEVDRELRQVAQTDLFGHVTLNLESEAELRPVLERLLGVRLRDLGKHAAEPWIIRSSAPCCATGSCTRSSPPTARATWRPSIHAPGASTPTSYRSARPPGGWPAAIRTCRTCPAAAASAAAFRAPEGRRLVTADYAGCELRILAEASEDPAFVHTFQRGGDLHAIVASRSSGRP